MLPPLGRIRAAIIESDVANGNVFGYFPVAQYDMLCKRRYTLSVNADQIMAGAKGSEYIAAVGVGSRTSTDGAVRSDLEPGKWLTGRSVGNASKEYDECERCERGK